MIEAARNAVEGSNTRILAVTVLTSLNDEMLWEEWGLKETTAEVVPRFALMAADSGAHGIVCSPLEIAAVRRTVGAETMIVTPGIRPEWAAGGDDQARVLSPREAAEAGADMIVVGRPILKHQNPAEAVKLIMEELAE
jgi:orotidine-5'-phosphate decarboxylase